MASASTVNEWGEMDDYTEDELAEIVHEIEKYEKEQLEESDVEVGEGLDGEEESRVTPKMMCLWLRCRQHGGLQHLRQCARLQRRQGQVTHFQRMQSLWIISFCFFPSRFL